VAEHHLYIEAVGLIFYLYYLETLEGSVPHKRVEPNQRTVGHY